MLSKSALLAAIVLAFTMLAVAAWARTGDSTEGRPMMGKHFAELNLTSDQKDKLKELRKQWMESAEPVFEQMKAVREKAKAELLKKEPSQQALDDCAAQMGDLHKQLSQKFQAHMLKAKAVLSAEQFEKLMNFDWMGPGPGMEGGWKHHGEKGKPTSDKDGK